MTGYVGVLRRTSIDEIFDQLFQKFNDQKQFQGILDQSDIQEKIKEMVFSAIDSQQLQATVLREPEFAKNLVLSFVTAYIVEKYNKNNPNMPDLKLDVLFKKELDDPLEYQDLLTKLLKIVLIERNKLLPPEKQLSEEQINSRVDELMKSDDPKQEFINVLSLLAKESIVNDPLQPKPTPDDSQSKKDENEQRNSPQPNPAGVLGATDVPLADLAISDLTGSITSEQALPADIISSQHMNELKANAGELDLFHELTDIAKEVVEQEALRVRLTY